MLSATVAIDIRRLLMALRNATLFNQLVELLDDRHRSIQAFVGRMALGANLNESAGHVHGNFVSTHECLQGISLRVVYKQGERLLADLAELHFDADQQDSIKLGAEVQSFLTLVDSYAISRSASEAVDLLRQASVIRARIAQTTAVLEALLSKLEQEPLADGSDSLAVLMDGTYELADVVETLGAVSDICTRVAEVFASCGVAVSFRVRKIETGSLYWELVAERIGIRALRQLLSRGLDYWYRNHTPEGLLKHQVPLHGASIKEAMKIRNLLAKEGIETERLDEALAEQAEYLVERIGVIARKAHGVRLDGRSMTLRAPLELPAPAETDLRRLGHDEGKADE